MHSHKTHLAIFAVVYVIVIILVGTYDLLLKPEAVSKSVLQNSLVAEATGYDLAKPVTSGADVSVLKDWDTLMLIATYVPSGFATTSVTAEHVGGSSHQYGSYSIKYCNGQDKCFIVESTCDGMGDGYGGDIYAIATSSLLGRYNVNYLRVGEEGNTGSDDYVISSWMFDFDKSHPLTKDICSLGGMAHHLRGVGISLNQAVSIINSLTPVY